MATRQYYSVLATAEASTTATSFQNAATLTFTPDDNADYLMFWCFSGQNDDGNSDGNFLAIDASRTATHGAWNVEPQDLTSWNGFAAISRATFATATGSYTFNVRYAAELGSATTRIRDISIIALKMGAADQFTEAANVTSTATSFTAATFSFTPSATGSYLMLGSNELQYRNTAGDCQIQFLVGTGTATAFGLNDFAFQDETSYMSWIAAQKLDLTATETIFEIRVIDNPGTATSETRRSRIAALRLDKFDSDYATQTLTEATTTATSYQNYLTLSATTAAKEHLLIFTAVQTMTNNTSDGELRFISDGATEQFNNAEVNVANNRFPYGVFRLESLTAAAHSFQIDYKSELGTATINMDSGGIYLIDVEGAATATATAGAFLPKRLLLLGVGT